MNLEINKNTVCINPLLFRGGRGRYFLCNKSNFVWFCFCCLMLTLSNFTYAASLNDRYLELQDRLTKEPNNLNLQMDLAFLFSQGLEFQRAIEIYENVTKTDPVNQRAWVELCALKTQLQDRVGAQTACESVIRIAPNEAWAHDNLGLMHFKLGQYEKSLKPFLKALALDQSHSLVLVHFAQSLMALNQFETARDILMRVSQRSTVAQQDAELIHHTLYQANRKLKRHQDAYESILQTWRISGNDIYLGKVVSGWMKANEMATFGVVALIVLGLSQYFGKRINRFLKNEV